jgi:hypothetical protein
MKKTLAAVLAAAMALSTATVAFAHDIEGDPNLGSGSLDSNDPYAAKMGDTSKYILHSIDMENNSRIGGSELAWAINEGYLTSSVVVTSNQNKLAGRPVLDTGKRVVDHDETIKVKKYVWANDAAANAFKGAWSNVEGIDTKNMAGGKEITFIVTLANGALVDSSTAEGQKVVRKGDSGFDDAMDLLIAHAGGGYVEEQYDTVRNPLKSNALQLSFKVNHTYGIDDVTVKMKIRFTVKKLPKDQSSLVLGGKDYYKGDTITSEEMSFKAKYYELSNYYEDMQLTSSEVGANRVILDGANLYDAIGAKTFTISFGDDVAVFVGKAAPNQKKINLYWTVDELDEYDSIKAQYPDVDFTFLKFRGNPAPSFQNSGTMYFAADDKDYQVYSWDGETLDPMNGEFDPTYKVIEVKGIKKLGTYVIADQILEVEEEPEEPAEPVDSTPVAEPDNDEGGNPNTGAC